MNKNKDIKNIFYNNIDKYSKVLKENKLKFIPGKSSVPVSGKVLDAKDIKYMVEASLEGWLTTGKFNKKFEKKISQEIGSKSAITVCSGSAANLVAFSSLCSPKLGDRQIKQGDEVITVAASFPTTVNPIIQNNCIPCFVDIEIPTYNINAEKIEKHINNKTKAIMVAHTLGNPFNVKKIRELCDKYNLWLVQDSCDAFGAKFDEKKLGFCGDIGTISFYPAHHITTGEGGAVFFNNIRLKRIAESIRDWGRDCYCEPGKDNTCGKRFGWKLGELPEGYDHKYTYSHLGYNLKITDLQAACGLSQISKLNKFVKSRLRNFNLLRKKLKKVEKFFLFPQATKNSQPSWFGFLLTVKPGAPFDRESLVKFLNSKKIGTRLLFSGNITKQPYMKNVKYKVLENLTNTDLVMKNSFWIGVYPGLSDEHINYIVEQIEIFVQKYL